MAALSAKVEAELAVMEPDDAAEFRADLGLAAESPLNRAIGVAYDLLGLHSFLTAGEDECRAWAVRKGAVAPVAAGVIHSDLQRGFIRAETTAYDDLIAAGSMAAAKKANKVRLDGKGYEVQDGAILEIRCSV